MNSSISAIPASAGMTAIGINAAEADCANEPIRVPGAIQQHGFCLVTDAELATVQMASDNAQRFLGAPLALILGARLEDFLERELLTSLQGLRVCQGTEQQGTSVYLGSYRVGGQFFSVVSHCSGHERMLEFELQDRLVGSEMMNGVITNFVGKLSRLETQQELCDALAKQVAELTGFDRVMLYSFDHDDHGTVLSEVSNGHLPSYLGLRFPASDIPRQARELYVLNTVRIIPDAGYAPSPLKGVPGTDAEGLDLSLSTLRSVSPVHIQYMKNMGTLASMSVSLVTEGRLWGLISAHNAEPKLVPYLVRSACDMLSKVTGTQLTSFRTAARLKQTVQLHAVQRDIITELAAEPNYLDGLTKVLPQLLDVTEAEGVALFLDGRIMRHGELPGEADVRRIVEWLHARQGNERQDRERQDSDVWSSSFLASELPWADELSGSASGLLAVRISSVQQRYILWFRPEVVKMLRWAGEPQKVADNFERLNPRNSFAEWKETVHGRSMPWSPVEVGSARDFRASLTTIGLRRAEEAIQLGEARFQQLTLALPVRVFTVDDAGRLTYTNERWRTSGLGGSGTWYEEAHLAEEDTALCAAGWSQCVQQNRTFEAEVRVQNPEGTPASVQRWNFVRIVPFQREGAERAGWIGCFVDLTESKERELAVRMNEKLALTGRMTSVIAHEINNPLEAITNLMYLLRSEVEKSGPAASYIGMVESELERISGITKQTLRWNRETSDARETFLAGPIVDDVLRLFTGKIRNRQITVTTAGNRGVQMFGVVGQLRQVLANLVSNALDAAPVGGEVEIAVLDGHDADSQVGFAVKDNGRGVPTAAQSRLFEPFFSTKGDLGNGLGLYISREIVERHSGVIELQSTSASGTTMRVVLPKPGTPAAMSATP